MDGGFIVPEQEQVEIPLQEEFYQVPVRFGNVPVDKAPLGWDETHRFEKVYPRVSLPFQQIERLSFGQSELEPNRLFFGDNLHLMRMLPSKSIDLIYIDPPFFSGRNYNILYGDKNELRSFKDIWEGGMPGYLIWLNARLYEMKRLLKDTGSIYLHLDWHAVHYAKIEMDKIFGYDNLISEIIWSVESVSGFKSQANKWIRGHDTILFYSRSKGFVFNKQYRKDFAESTIKRYDKTHEDGRKYKIYWENGEERRQYLDEAKGKPISDVWADIPSFQTINAGSEYIGYPTQKREALLERIIRASTNDDDVVADFFCGGGTTPAVAQRLGRRWIASDISRVAVALTADRLAGQVETELENRVIQPSLEGIGNIPDISIEHWGVYEVQKLGKMKPGPFRKFIIEAYNGRPDSTSDYIHGYKDGEPLYVCNPEPETRVSKEEVVSFAETILTKKGIHKGTMLGWAFGPETREIRERLAAREGVTLDFVKLNLVPIDSPEFKSHVTNKHSGYTDLLSFILPPSIRFGFHKLEDGTYEFDVSESTSMNPNGTIINVQWDFEYKNRFTSTRGYSFLRGKKNESLLKVSYTFPSKGHKTIACRVQDDMGGEATLIKELDVE